MYSTEKIISKYIENGIYLYDPQIFSRRIKKTMGASQTGFE